MHELYILSRTENILLHFKTKMCFVKEGNIHLNLYFKAPEHFLNKSKGFSQLTRARTKTQINNPNCSKFD